MFDNKTGDIKMNIRKKLEIAEELWSKTDDDDAAWNAEDYRGWACSDVKTILNNIKINDEMSFFDIINDFTIDVFTLILELKEDIPIIDIKFETLRELNDKLGGDIELSYMNGMMFIYKTF